MNKRVYMFLKKIIDKTEKSDKDSIKAILDKQFSEEELKEYNKQFNTDNFYSEIEIKFIILDKNINLFTTEEYNFYKSLLSIKKLLKK